MENIKKSKYFKNDNFFQLLGYSQNYLFHQNYFLSFIHAWIFLESCINVLWRELIHETYHPKGSTSTKDTPLKEEGNWTIQIKIEELFMKEIISKDLKNNLQSLRTKRNKVFHLDKKLSNRNVSKKEADTAVITGLTLFYKMLEPKKQESEIKIFTFREVQENMWKAINRAPLPQKKIKDGEIVS